MAVEGTGRLRILRDVYERDRQGQHFIFRLFSTSKITQKETIKKYILTLTRLNRLFMIVQVARNKNKKNKEGKGGNQGERGNLLTYSMVQSPS